MHLLGSPQTADNMDIDVVFGSPDLIWHKATDDLSLPKATIQKIISEILGDKSGLTFGKDARDLLIECCVEFVTMISSQANDIAEQDAKKTIATEHIEKALRELGFPEYVGEVLAAAGEHRDQLKVGKMVLVLELWLIDYADS
jgi:histone H3/H4